MVAEGIVLDEQLQRLRNLGCALGQGFHFARPMESEKMLDYLAAGSSVASVLSIKSAPAAPNVD